MHESVGSTGTTKRRHFAETLWIGVDVEEWDDTMHVSVTDPLVFGDELVDDNGGEYEDSSYELKQQTL